MQRLVNNVRTNAHRYLLAIFVDITGAFNNVWWPSVMNALVVKRVPADVTRVIRSYLTDRSIRYTSKTSKMSVSKCLSKGCPQGSVLGPTLWNLVMDSLLGQDIPYPNVDIFAYADDIAITVSASNRRDLEAITALCLQRLTDWAGNNKLSVSVDKTKYMVFGSKLQRNPTVRLYNRAVRRVFEFKYLGLLIDDKLSFVKHCSLIVEKGKKLIHLFYKYTRLKWNLPKKSLESIFHCAVLPTLTYGLNIWYDRLRHSHVVRKLASLQALFLRTYLGAYRTVPNDSLCVIAKHPPLHLLLQEVYCTNLLRRTGTCTLFNSRISRDDFPSFSAVKRHVKTLVLGEWQRSWDASIKGRNTYSLIPNIQAWLHQDHVPGRAAVRILTSHGAFGCHRKRIGVSEDDLCPTCGVSDTPAHRVLACREYDGVRAPLLASIVPYPDSPQTILVRIPDVNVLRVFTS